MNSPLSEPQNPAIQQLIADGKTDAEIVKTIVAESGVTEGDAWQILAWEKGEDADDVIDAEPTGPSTPGS